jgi:cyclase
MRAFFLTAAIALCGSAPALAQQDFSKVEVKPVVLAPGVAVLFGAGGNIGVSYGPDGTVLIDDQFAPITPKIEAAIKGLGATPVKFLINTHWHYDHTGGNENFGKAGALIMAHDNVRVRMAAGATVAGNAIPPAPPVALPVVTYHDGLSLHLNGDEIRTMHMHDGHTDGDSIVWWKKANVIHMGDLFMNKVSLPFVDLASGGDVRGFVVAADKVLAMTNAETRIIPGHGPMATRADLQAWRDLIADVIGKVEAGIKAKKTLTEIQAMKPAAPYEVKDAFIGGDAFVEAVYKSLTAPPKPHKH